jgi:hypothetical protein
MSGMNLESMVHESKLHDTSHVQDHHNEEDDGEKVRDRRLKSMSHLSDVIHSAVLPHKNHSFHSSRPS